MRLLCPNCDAEYEVDAAVIPDNGRDVQCSNCGHAWFQLPPEVEAAQAAEAALYDAPAPVVAAAETTVIEDLPRRGLDESVLAVLREEAERETAARRAEASGGLETQTEMGLQPTEAAGGLGGAVARRIARLKGVDPAVAVRTKPQTRREMLPEIEEINSSLRASSEKRSGEAAAVAATMAAPVRKGSAFRNGFVLMVLTAVILVAVYVMAPKITGQIPGAAGALKTYVAGIDSLRMMLDGAVQSAIDWLRGAAGGAAQRVNPLAENRVDWA